MNEREPTIEIREQILPGYRNLTEDYFDLLKKGEITISRGLMFTQIADADWEETLVITIIEQLRRARSAYMMVNFEDYLVEHEKHQEDFTRFFANIWELSDPSFKTERSKYLARLERVMRHHPESDPERCSQLILRNLPTVASMTYIELEKLKDLLFMRMENSLPLFIFFKEDFSQFLRDASRMPDIIWAVDECTYPAERYLFHPYGLRYIALLNRRMVFPHF